MQLSVSLSTMEAEFAEASKAAQELLGARKYLGIKENGEGANASGNTAGDINSRIKKNSGRKGIDKAFVEAKIRATPIHKRRKIKSTAIATGFSVGVIQRLLVEKRFQRRSTLIKPVLTEENKLRRLAYAHSFLKSDSQRVGEVEGHTFDTMFDMVHVDEKMFDHDTKNRVYYLLPGEELPVRYLHSARFIEKTMFLAAVARPR
uniref:Mariner transposase putative n=1 Tax=Albugo laibachii Nc14 TaxID=890382 RepID=F0WZV2_9STRA|nr:mariner transposase putative [Albugo laibachii Nc14]|eukprot:CCA27029.1 mariner transposase putative [Albugo laibachii Nc14]